MIFEVEEAARKDSEKCLKKVPLLPGKGVA